jgi:diguanylate cyclase (GGDEF)-like protein
MRWASESPEGSPGVSHNYSIGMKITADTIDARNDHACAMLHQNTREALRLAEQVREEARSIDYLPGLAQSIYLIGQCYFILGNEKDPMELINQSLHLFRNLKNREREAGALNMLSLIYKRKGDYDISLDLLLECLNIRCELGDVLGESKSLNNLGNMYRDLFRYADALECLLRSLELAEQAGSDDMAAYASGNMAQVFSERGDQAAALKHYEQSLAYNSATKDLAFRSTILAGMGQAYLKQDSPERALNCLLHSLELTDQTGNLDDRGITLHYLGLAYLEMGHCETSAGYLYSALEIFQREGNQPQETEVSLALGQNLLRQGRLDEAIVLLEQLLERESGFQEEVHRLLAEAHEKKGNFPCALSHFRQFYQCHARIHDQKSEQRIQELLTRSEVQKVERDVATQRQANDELARALEAARQAQTEKEVLLQQLLIQAEVLKQLAREDGLTGVANRRWLDYQLAQELARARRFGHPLSVALVDLDHFKSVNDRLSHQIGDEVLKVVARLLRETCRSVDLVGRYGGEEFVLVLVETDARRARPLCERVRRAVERYDWRSVHPELSGVTLSIGLCSDHSLTASQELLTCADQQLYRAKAQGRNQVCFSRA